jgi:hypothetical protein
MQRRAYTSDLTDEEPTLLAPLIPSAKLGGRPRKHDIREVLNAIFYAGMGKSEQGPLPRSSERIARELHTALKKANVNYLCKSEVAALNCPARRHLATHSLLGVLQRLSPMLHFEQTCGLWVRRSCGTPEARPSSRKLYRPFSSLRLPLLSSAPPRASTPYHVGAVHEPYT